MNSIQELFDNFDENVAGRGLSLRECEKILRTNQISLWVQAIVGRFYSTV